MKIRWLTCSSVGFFLVAGCVGSAAAPDAGELVDAPARDAGAAALDARTVDAPGSTDAASSSDAPAGGDAPTADAWAARCGDGRIEGGERCDDGNIAAGDGCAADCASEDLGYDCTGTPSVCAPVCGDGVRVGVESDAGGCDDGNTSASDGCSDTCHTEPGWDCGAGTPTTCAPLCGDGLTVGAEAGPMGCDDANALTSDGCADCRVEAGWSCGGAPSTCSTGCGDGIVAGMERCDDGNERMGDGCSAACQPEPGFACSGAPSMCASTCGDGALASDEGCDDGALAGGDGCSASCAVEPGWVCDGSTCNPVCGDRLVVPGVETCDDGNGALDECAYGATSCTVCGPRCTFEPGVASFCGDSARDVRYEACDDGNTTTETACPYGTTTCVGCDATCASASMLSGNTCGDGIVDPIHETCDDAGTTPGDGCDASCQAESGWTCTGEPSSCRTVCGDRIVAGAEECDDGNTVTEPCANGESMCTICDATCRLTPGVTWRCGNGVLEGPEQCDDGGPAGGDGCSQDCGVEPSFTCAGVPSVCVGTASYTGQPLAIPDANATGVTLRLTGAGPRCAIDHFTRVAVTLTHTWVGDLVVRLSSGASSYLLFDRPGVPGIPAGNRADLGGTYAFVSDGTSPVIPEVYDVPMIAPGTYHTSDVNGARSPVLVGATGGPWSVTVVDFAIVSTGTVQGAEVSFVCRPNLVAARVSVLTDCNSSSAEIFRSAPTTYCQDLADPVRFNASWLRMDPGVVSVELFEQAGCAGGRAALSADGMLCGVPYDTGPIVNDNVGSIRVNYY